MNRFLITLALVLSPLAAAGNLAATPAFPGAPPDLWCCATRDRLSPLRPNPPAPPMRGAAVDAIGRVARRRRSSWWTWLRRETPSPQPLPVQQGHFLIEGMRCASCMTTIETHLLQLPGIHAARVSFSGQRATVTWDPTLVDPIAAVAAAGFLARPYDPSVTSDPMRRLNDAWLLRLGVAGFGAAATMFLAEPLYYASAPTDVYGQALRLGGAIVATLTGAYAGGPFLQGALKSRTLGMDALVSLGAIATYLASLAGLVTHGAVYFDALMMLLFLLTAGRFAEAAMRRRVYGAMERLLGHTATTCRVWDGDTLVTLPLEALATGMELELAPGEQAPADGVVVRGRTHVVEAMLTGEPTPVPKGPGDEVLGGTQNAEGAIRLRLTRVGPEAAHARLQSLVQEAAAGKSPLQRLADRAGHIGTLAVAATAALTALGWALVDPAR
ncbi:MAG: heavy metal translocating P-type ATPase, partial [Cyanobacteria bacterium RYN_339]|nr:heavy metal translocating P-type ATPase [Cyanobacteria bacterium RYN_339]